MGRWIRWIEWLICGWTYGLTSRRRVGERLVTVYEDLYAADARIDVPVTPLQRDPLDINMCHTIYISGPHHILSNCQNDLPSVLSHWSWAVLRLSNICRLLTRRYYKQRLLATCFPEDGPHAAFIGDIEGFHGHCHAERWGTTAAAAVQLLAIFSILINAWNKDAFLQHGHLEKRDSEQSCTD